VLDTKKFRKYILNFNTLKILFLKDSGINFFIQKEEEEEQTTVKVDNRTGIFLDEY
jgi:stress response protein SCP2